MKLTKRNGVAPVLVILLIIAVTVAIYEIIFIWPQGFLSTISNASSINIAYSQTIITTTDINVSHLYNTNTNYFNLSCEEIKYQINHFFVDTHQNTGNPVATYARNSGVLLIAFMNLYEIKKC